MNDLLITLKGLVFEYGPRLVGAILVLIVGLWVIRLIMRGIKKGFNRSNIEDSLKPFLLSLIRTVFRILLFISVLGMIGIEMTSFIAILGAAGLAIGMALSGTLQNFAGGVIILLFKPYKVGDVIEAQGHIGSVKEIQIFNTILRTGDNKTVIIPNGGLSNATMVNYTAEGTRRVEWTFGIAYGEDTDRAREIVTGLISEDERILKEPEMFTGISQLADSSVNILVRAWVKGANYWSVFYDMNDKVYKAFTKAGISIPFPQMDVHIQNK